MDLDEELAHNLTEARKSLQISQKDAADSIGVKLNTYGAWERGVNTIPLAHLITFCSVHNILLGTIIPTYDRPIGADITGSNIALLFDHLLKSGANAQLVSQVKDRFISLLEELSNEKQKVINEKEKLDKVLKLIEERFNVKIDR